MYIPKDVCGVVKLSSTRQVGVPSLLFDEVEQIYAPPDNPVFQLVPPPFEQHVRTAYGALGSPPISHRTFWEVYTQLVNRFHNNARDIAPTLSSFQPNSHFNDPIDLLPGLQELPNGDRTISNNGREGSTGRPQYAQFTDDDDSGSDWDD